MLESPIHLLNTLLQRWLGIRVDFLGILLTFIVAILTIATRFSISPAQTGVTLSYILLVQQVGSLELLCLYLCYKFLPFSLSGG